MKKITAIILALLMIICSLPVAFATETENYKLTTEFYADDGSGNYVPVTSVPAGSNVKLRVSIETNFVSASATMMFAYDKTVLSAEGISSSASAEMKLNSDFDFVNDNIQTVIGADGMNAARNQYVEGNLTLDQLDEYGFLIFSTRTKKCVYYDGSDWIFELDMKTLKGSKGKTLECFVIPETVCTVENGRGVVSFPKAPSIDSTSAELESAFIWYEGTPVLESAKVLVTPSLAERTISWFVDGVEEKVDYYEIGDEITTEWIPEKKGYVFAGWNPAIPETMPDENIVTNATWEPATDTKYCVQIYKKYGNSYGLASETYCTGTTGETVTAEYNVPEGFHLNTEKSRVSGVIRANGSLTLQIYFDRNTYKFTSVVDGVETSADYLYDENISIPETPEKEGYVFAGWEPSIPAKMPANDLTVSATWIAADDVAYTVETYTMGTDGEYVLVATAHEGTTGETVTASYATPEGFALNEENSVLSGVVTADGSLVLKVYIDRNIYKFTADVDGVKTSAEYFYGEKIDAPEIPSKSGYVFAGWSAPLPDTMPANDVDIAAKFNCIATVKIKNNPGTKTIKYGEKLRLTAETANMPEGAKLYWYVDGVKKGEGTTFEVSVESGTAEVTVKIVDKNGNPFDADGTSDMQKVSVNAGFFQKIISFFKNLFGMNRTIIQMINRI